MLKNNNKPMRHIRSIYIHIPFCGKLCPFCGFAVRKDRKQFHQTYLDALSLEFQKQTEQYCESLAPLESIYIGGGTPSRLSVEELRRLMLLIKKNFKWNDTIEIAIELNPEDVNRNYLKCLEEIGVTRLSLGGQSFNSDILKTLGRSHTPQHFWEAIKLIRNSGIDNFNLDLMFGVPGQTLPMYREDIKEVINVCPTHVSLYSLEVIERTAFIKQKNILAWVGQENYHELCENMYLWGVEALEDSGLYQYEVSNFASKGNRGKSNLCVWDGEPYLGFGAGAHSYISPYRWANVRSATKYVRQIQNGVWPIDFEERLSPSQQANEVLMLKLRQPAGINISEWENDFGVSWSQEKKHYAELLCENGYTQWKSNILSLTKQGFLIADAITAKLMC